MALVCEFLANERHPAPFIGNNLIVSEIIMLQLTVLLNRGR